MGQNNIIELNGKQYDAITGALLGESRVKATPVSGTHRAHQGRVIDGFMRKSAHQAAMPTVAPIPKVEKNEKAIHKAKPASGGPKMADIKRAVPKQAKAHQPERSKTLMRHVVAKPKATMKPAIKTTAPTEMMAKPKSELSKLEKKISVTQVNPMRLARANHVAKSHHIKRFQKPRYEHQTIQRKTYATAVSARPVSPDMRPASRPAHIASRSVALEQAAQRLAAKQSATDLFEQALIQATSHEEPLRKPAGRRAARHRRVVSLVAGLGAFLIIGGFITYLNMPGIELRVASMHAGFHAQMPNYKPTGYALAGGIKASDGKVELTYRSGDSAYRITQVASDWNSVTLLDQNTEKRGAPSQTIQSEGRIIYIYSDSKASWVDGGVRYEISGNANLTTDDLVSLATSM